MGLRVFFKLWGAFFRAVRRDPGTVRQLMREGFFRRMRNVESLGENLWCFMAGFLLAEQCRADGITLIHAAWANGPATAAWVASRLTGIPFAFTGRAGDIYPQDGILREKSRDALFIRTNNLANVRWLQSFCRPDQRDKVRHIYNCLTFTRSEKCRLAMQKPYRLLAVGRFARTKGFPELLTAMARLQRERVPVRLTLVGDGLWRRRLSALRKRLHLTDVVDMPGFVPHDQLRDFMQNHDALIVPSVVHRNGDRDGIPNVIMEALSHWHAGDRHGRLRHCRGDQGRRNRPASAAKRSQALALAVRRILEDKEQARRMAEAGQALVQRMFDGDANITALRDLYVSQLRRWRAEQTPQEAEPSRLATATAAEEGR